jgi:hypothetical protein
MTFAEAVWTIPPLEAVTVSGYVPGGAVADVLTVTTALPAPCRIVGLTVALPTDDGTPEAATATSPVNPFNVDTVTV